MQALCNGFAMATAGVIGSNPGGACSAVMQPLNFGPVAAKLPLRTAHMMERGRLLAAASIQPDF